MRIPWTLRLIALLGLTSLACQSALWRQSLPAPTAEPTLAATSTPAATPQTESASTLSFVEAVADDANTFNPLLGPNATARSVIDKILPHLLALDPASGEVTPTELATGWAWSLDGRALTVTLRSGIQWSDGMPVTARDATRTFAALASPEAVAIPGFDASVLESVTAPDLYTLSLRLREADCSVLQMLTLPLIPSHLFTETTPLADNPWNAAPSVGAGPFLYEARLAGEGIVLRRNQSFWKDPARISRYRFVIIPDAAQRLASVRSGAADLAADLGTDPGWQPEPPALQTAPRLLDGYSLLALNLADPAAPQPGHEETGALIPQTPHPVLGDVRVRRAIAAGVNFQTLVRASWDEAAAPLVSWVLPSIPWAHDAALPPYGYNIDGAALLLEEAGWSLPAGESIRRKGETPLSLRLVTNNDNPRRVALAEGVRDALTALGFEVTLDLLPFESAGRVILEQRYDMAILGWENLGSDPATVDFFLTEADAPGVGSNVTSYQNPELDRLLEQARTVPGCRYAERGALYRQAQRTIYEDVPVIMLSGLLTTDAWNPAWQGLAPAPWADYQGVEHWRRQ